MGDRFEKFVGFGVWCFFFIPFALQIVSFFIPFWVQTKTCPSVGLFYSCCQGDRNKTCGFDNDGVFNLKVLILESVATAIVLVIFSVQCIASCYFAHSNDDSLQKVVIGVLGVASYLVAGGLSLAGLIETSNILQEHWKLGDAFFVCLVAVVIIFTGIVTLIIVTIVKLLSCLNIATQNRAYSEVPQSDRIEEHL